eukprot:832327_1
MNALAPTVPLNVLMNMNAYQLIGTCCFWTGAWDFPIDKANVDAYDRSYIDFTNNDVNVEIKYMAIHDGGDICSFHSRFGFKGSSCTCYCVMCEINQKNRFSTSDSLSFFHQLQRQYL